LRALSKSVPRPDEGKTLADIDRRRRFAGRLKKLIDVAIEQKNVSGGASLARQVMILEGWISPNSKDDLQQEPGQPTDVSSLLAHLQDQSDGKEAR
jgi:hypothetical protein